LYKVWSLHKRFTGKGQTQYLTVAFKNDAGEEKNMTLELGEATAPVVLSMIQRRTAEASAGWWGDRVWKTTRNADKWNHTATTASAK
jgi:hypothetical protein